MSEANDNNETFRPLDRTGSDSSVKRLKDYGFETRTDLSTGNSPAGQLLDREWTDRTGFENLASRRVHLMFLHLYGTSGQTVRDEIAGVDRAQAYEQMLELNWNKRDLDTVIDAVDEDTRRRQALLQEKLPSGRIPLFRGVHCISPTDDTVEATALQRWVEGIIRKGVDDGTVQIDPDTNEPTGYVRNVEPFTSTVDSWTCSYAGATYWSQTRLPGNETCMVMAANVAHSAVVLWRNDSHAMDEILVLGGTGAVNVYFQEQIMDKATPSEMEHS